MKHPILCALFSSLALPVMAGTTIPSLADPQLVSTNDDGWQFRTAAYIWATDLDGDMVVRGETVPVDVGFDDLISKIEFSFMGVMELRKGRWGLMSDLFYAKLGIESDRPLVNIDCEIEQFIGNFAVAYRWVETPKTVFDTYVGVRVNWMETDVKVDRFLAPDATASGSKAWVDPIIGIRYQRELSNQFFFRAVGDVGGFEMASDFTWQALAAIGYHINDNSSVALGYRALGTDYTNNEITYDVTSHGLLLGYETKF
jgi:hypothetical protein